MSPQPDNLARSSADLHGPSAREPSPAEYSAPERQLLLHLAHESIQATLDGRPLRLPDIPDHLKQPRGAFTTIYLDGQVRGCVGYVQAVAPLYQTVAETASAAAFHDLRFLPVNREEAARLKVSISVLSPLTPIGPENIELGRHGLLISMGNRRGLLLPQVSIEHHWDVTTFLQQTCRKAGLDADAWQRGATLEGFTAEIFGEIPEP
jgi:AmmeMemoRadiSam system protein A